MVFGGHETSCPPWVIAVVAIIAFAASFSELQRVRKRFGEVSQHKFHDHQDVRKSIIRANLAGLDHPIVLLGDSITEMARLPESVNGHPIMNAGIGGASIGDFLYLAPQLLEGVTPSIIIVALGANDVGSASAGTTYAALLSRLKQFCPSLLAVKVTTMEGADAINSQIGQAAAAAGVLFIETSVPASERLQDRIHLTPNGSMQWTAAVVAAIAELGS